MKIVLTGATGFIGKNIAIELARQGHEVRALVRDVSAAIGLPCTLTQWTDAALTDVLSNSDAVIHLSGHPVASMRWTDEVKKQIYDTRIDSTKKIIESIESLPKESRPKTLLCASAIGFYGDRKDEVLTEESAPGEGFLSDVVKDWEKEAVRGELLGLRVVRMRIGIVLGRDGGALEKMAPVVLGNGKQWMSWIHLNDVVRFALHALKTQTVSGVYNVVSPNAVRNSEFTHILGRVKDQKVLLSAPAIALKTVLGEMSNVVMGSAHVKPKRTLESGFQYLFENLEQALNDIHGGLKKLEKRFSAVQFVPRPIEEVFRFFSLAENLESLTPPWLNFQITNKSTPDIRENTLIDYRLKIHGVPVKWRTRIEKWNPSYEFVDNQLRGPYSRWHHTHRFESLAGGTLISDDVIYQLPVGILGSVFGGSFVRNDVEKIFAYRMKVISEVFKN